MTTSISTLARVVRQIDVTSTLRSFLVVLAPFLVVWNIATIGTAARFFFSEDMSDDFFFDEEEIPILAGILAIGVLAALAPLLLFFREWVARRETGRQVSAIVGALLGTFGLLLLTAALCLLLYFMEEEAEPFLTETMVGQASCVFGAILVGLIIWLLTKRRWIARTLLGIFLAPVVLLIVGLPVLLTIDEELGWQQSVAEFGKFVVLLVALLLIARTLVRAIRLRIILAGSVPRNLIFGAFVRKGFWVRVAQVAGLPSSLWSSAAMLSLAFWFLMLARPVTYVGAAFFFRDREEVENWHTLLVAGAILIIVGHTLFYLGKRLAARNIWKPAEPSGDRAPILFLRSFQDDQLRLKRPWWNLVARWFDLWSFRRNVDEALVDEIAQYGPVVALGQPGEKSAPFGAMRYYSTHEQWQTIVTETARRAQAIVIVAGDSPGVLWEFEFLAQSSLVDRTLLLFRPGEHDMNVRALEAFSRVTGGRTHIVEQGRQMVALLQSRNGPILLTAEDASAEAYLTAIRAHFQKADASVLEHSELLIERPAMARKLATSHVEAAVPATQQ